MWDEINHLFALLEHGTAAAAITAISLAAMVVAAMALYVAILALKRIKR